MIVPIKNLDTEAILYFESKSAYDAMKKLKYYLSLKDKKAQESEIKISPLNNFLYVVYRGETYCAKL